MSSPCEDLPEECWELILNRLDHHSHFRSISLVNTRFLSLTNRLRLKFTVVDPTFFIHGTISPLLRRFSDLKTLDLSQLRVHANLETSLLEITRSCLLNLEALDISNQKFIPIRFLKELGVRMINLKVLKCANLGNLRDRDLISIANFLPCLEELYISYPSNHLDFSRQFAVTDSGIEVLSCRLNNLHKIDISGNHFLTCKSLLALSSNCLRLREICMLDCPFITLNGVRFLLHNSPDLCAISMSVIESLSGSSLFIESATFGRSLCSLDFQYSDVCDEFLFSISKACIPLKRISLSGCAGYTIDGISFLLHTYRSLEFLDLTGNNSLVDLSMVGLSQYLHSLVAIKLNSCSKLTDSTLFTLAKNCPFLKDVEMNNTSLGKEEGYSFTEFVKNPSIRSLNLAWNLNLCDACLTKIALVCPNLERLDVSSCLGITGGIAEISKSCREIRHLSMNDCGGVKNIRFSHEISKLEILLVARSGLGDEGLGTIGNNCSGLMKLDLAGCLNVTTSGVKNAVRECEKLREIDLKGCRGVSKSIVDWMVFTRPSLKKLIPPCYDATTENQRKLLLRHGCQVCEN